jgi:hypothetical protein
MIYGNDRVVYHHFQQDTRHNESYYDLKFLLFIDKKIKLNIGLCQTFYFQQE